MSDDYDTPWKDALTRYFPEFMAFYFPLAHGRIDWSVPHVFLEQELAQVAHNAKVGPRRVDKLVKVAKKDGDAEWVLVHVDVQSHHDKDFAERVFVYNYRIYDYFRQPAASLAVLADGSAHWRPASFDYDVFGCAMGIRFPIVKLKDYESQLPHLLREQNVFGLVTAAHLLTQRTRGRHVKRHAAKWCLARKLYERNWDRPRILDLFNFIDWIMEIPAPLQAQLMRDIEHLERKIAMPFINSFERRGLERGRQEGRQEGREEGLRELLGRQLAKRFGALPATVHDRLTDASPDQLQAWGEAVLDAPNLDSVFGRH